MTGSLASGEDATHDVLPVVLRYFNALDARDDDLLAECFTRPFEFRLSASTDGSGGRLMRDMPELAAAFDEFIGNGSTIHALSNCVARRRGDLAEARTHGVAYVLSPGTGRVAVRGVRYLDTFEQHEGEWRIARRAHIPLWVSEAPVTRLDA